MRVMSIDVPFTPEFPPHVYQEYDDFLIKLDTPAIMK